MYWGTRARGRGRVRGGPSGSEFVLASLLACLAWLPTPAHSTHSPKHERTYVCTISELAPSKFTTRPERSGERPSLSFSVGARGVAVAKVGFIYILVNSVKFIHSEKATKFCEISPLLLTAVHKVKSKGNISQKFVVFSEYLNFMSSRCN